MLQRQTNTGSVAGWEECFDYGELHSKSSLVFPPLNRLRNTTWSHFHSLSQNIVDPTRKERRGRERKRTKEERRGNKRETTRQGKTGEDTKELAASRKRDADGWMGLLCFHFSQVRVAQAPRRLARQFQMPVGAFPTYDLDWQVLQHLQRIYLHFLWWMKQLNIPLWDPYLPNTVYWLSYSPLLPKLKPSNPLHTYYLNVQRQQDENHLNTKKTQERSPIALLN